MELQNIFMRSFECLTWLTENSGKGPAYGMMAIMGNISDHNDRRQSE